MLNIISSVNTSQIGGPAKVVKNLLSGLDLIKYPYVLNKDINSTGMTYIPNDPLNLSSIKFLNENTEVIIGPNLYVFPSEINRKFKRYVQLAKYYLQPSQWPINFWKQYNFDLTELKPWAVGIDTYKFIPSVSKDTHNVLVYHKFRNKQELEMILSILRKRNIQYHYIEYGSYNEETFKTILDKTSFVIWHGCHESQGIALLECLSKDIPVLVCDVISPGDHTQMNAFDLQNKINKIGVTTAPYFDKRCGLIIKNINEFDAALTQMIDELKNYSPREFITENLSLEKQAEELISFYSKHPAIPQSDINALRLPIIYKSRKFVKQKLSTLKKKITK